MKYISFRSVFAIKFRLNELGFGLRTCLNAHSFALHSLSSSFSLPPCIFSPLCPDERLGFFQGYPLSKYWTNSPTQSLAFPLFSVSPSSSHILTKILSFFLSLFLSLSLSLYTAEQDKPQQGAGSWKTVDWRRPFLSSGGEKQFICPDPQYNFPRISRGEPASHE